MSYTGEIFLSDPLISFEDIAEGIGAVVTVGATVLAGTAILVGEAAKAVDEAVKTKRFSDAQAGLGKIAGSVSELDSRLESEMNRASEECRARYNEEIERAEAEFRKAPDTSRFISACAAASRNLDESLARGRRELTVTYAAALEKEIAKGRASIRETQREIERSLAAVSSDIEKKEDAKKAARSMMDEVKLITDDLAARSEGSEKAASIVSVLRQTLGEIENNYAAGLYESALAEIFLLRDSIFLRVQEMIKAENLLKHSYAAAKGLAESCRKMLDNSASAEYYSKKTFSGEEIRQTISDFPVYYRGDYQRMQQQLERIERILDADYRDFTEEQLIDLHRELSDWSTAFLGSTVTAYERLDNLFMRREASKVIYREYSGKGFRLVSADTSDELDNIRLELEHADTGESITLNLRAVTDGSGHITMNIDITDLTDYPGSEREIEESRNREREDLCSAVRSSRLGEGVKVRQRCKNPGVRLPRS